MIYIRKQTSQEIANITIVQGESIQLFGTQGYTVSQLQSINKLLGMNDCTLDLHPSITDKIEKINLYSKERMQEVNHE